MLWQRWSTSKGWKGKKLSWFRSWSSFSEQSTFSTLVLGCLHLWRTIPGEWSGTASCLLLVSTRAGRVWGWLSSDRGSQPPSQWCTPAWKLDHGPEISYLDLFTCVSKGYLFRMKLHWNLLVYVCLIVSVFSPPLKVSISCKDSRLLLVKFPSLVTVTLVLHSHSIPRRVVTFWSVFS